MRRSVPRDPWTLDEGNVAWHQQHTFLTEPRTCVERLVESPRFRTELDEDGWAVAEWMVPAEHDERLAFPLGRVTAGPSGVLLEAFSEPRLDALRRVAAGLGAGALTADETRSFPVATVLKDPRVLLQPLARRTPAARGIAETWLRFVWPFLVRADLGGRAPYALAGTVQGHEALSHVLDALAGELRNMPAFPAMSSVALHALLLPPETPSPVPHVRPRRGS